MWDVCADRPKCPQESVFYVDHRIKRLRRRSRVNLLIFFFSSPNFCSQHVALETTWESLSMWERNNEDLYLRSAATPSLLPLWSFTSLCVTFPVRQKRALKLEPRWPRRRSHWDASKCITQISLPSILQCEFDLDWFLACSSLIWPTWMVGPLPVLHKELLLSVSLATRTKTAWLLTGFVKDSKQRV